MGVEKPVKEKKAIVKKSSKQKDIDKELKHLYPPFLALPENEYCKIRSPQCAGKATVVHHSMGRGKHHVLDVSTFIACCPACNLWCETNHADAVKLRFKISPHTK
jgi:hypothetical protein